MKYTHRIFYPMRVEIDEPKIAPLYTRTSFTIEQYTAINNNNTNTNNTPPTSPVLNQYHPPQSPEKLKARSRNPTTIYNPLVPSKYFTDNRDVLQQQGRKSIAFSIIVIAEVRSLSCALAIYATLPLNIAGVRIFPFFKEGGEYV